MDGNDNGDGEGIANWHVDSSNRINTTIGNSYSALGALHEGTVHSMWARLPYRAHS